MSTLIEFKFVTECLSDGCVVTINRVNDTMKTYRNLSELSFPVYTSPGRIQKFIISMIEGEISINKILCLMGDQTQESLVLSVKIKDGEDSKMIHQARTDISLMVERDRFIFSPFVLAQGQIAEMKIFSVPFYLYK